MFNFNLPVYLKRYAIGLTSGFTSASLLKERIIMLYQKPSSPAKSVKFLFVLPIVLLCISITAFTQIVRTLQNGDIPEEYKHFKTFTIKAGKQERLSFNLKKGYWYAFHVVAVDGEFLPNQEVTFIFVDEKNKQKWGTAISQKTYKHRLFMKPMPFISYEFSVHTVDIITTKCTQDVYLKIYEADYRQVNDNTIHTLVNTNATHDILDNENYFTNRLQYPEKAKKENIQGVVEVSCVVNLDGTVSDIHITKSLEYGCDQEAMRLVSETKDWKSAVILDMDKNEKLISRHLRQRITIKVPFKL